MSCFLIGVKRGDISKYSGQCEHCTLHDCVADSSQCVGLYKMDNRAAKAKIPEIDKRVAKLRKNIRKSEMAKEKYLAGEINQYER